MSTDRAARFDAFVRRYFTLGFALLALPFVWLVSRNVAASLRFEDALIVLRYARNIADGVGFVFNPGERILGVTTPLHTLLSAGYVMMGRDIAPAIQNVSGVIFLTLEAWLTAKILQRTHAPIVGGLVAIVLLINLNFNYLYFGMETHLFAFLILLSFHLLQTRREVLCGLALGLAFLTRYDAALMALLIGLALLAERRKPPWRLAVAFFAVVTPWLLFSTVYFGSIVPSPLAAKKDYYPALGYVRQVFDYYREYFSALAGVFVPAEAVRSAISWLFPAFAFAGCLSLVKASRDYLVLILSGALLVVVYAALGPDPGFRWHYYMLNPVLTMLFLVGVYEVMRFGLWRGLPLLGAGGEARARSIPRVAFAVLLVWSVVTLFGRLDHRYKPDPHTRQLYSIAAWLDERYPDETSLLQPSIGILGYETNLRMIDHAGLVTPGLYYYDGIVHTPMAQVLDRHRPDLVLVPEGADGVLAEHGYRLEARFHDPHTYLLYERVPDGPSARWPSS
ncbi:MAG: hypothetical protein GY719_18050 [bacterium]|nr:hypothetical protein [bacterium]